MAWPRESPFTLYRGLNIPFQANNEVWGVTASSYWGNLQGARPAGWLAARLGYGGVHTHGYMRWFWNDHEGCFPGPDHPFDSVNVTNTAQGISDGRNLAQLLRMIEYARTTGRGAAVADEIAGQLQKTVLGTEKTCLLQIRHQPRMTGIEATWWTDVGLPPETFDAARRKVLEMSVRLKRSMGPVARDVYFADFPLVKDGQASCRVVADAAASRIIAEAVPELLGTKPAGGGPRLVVGTLKGSPEIREHVRRLPAGEITTHYPRAGRYAIHVVTASGSTPGALLIVGGDEAGLQKGVRNFLHVLRQANQW